MIYYIFKFKILLDLYSRVKVSQNKIICCHNDNKWFWSLVKMIGQNLFLNKLLYQLQRSKQTCSSNNSLQTLLFLRTIDHILENGVSRNVAALATSTAKILDFFSRVIKHRLQLEYMLLHPLHFTFSMLFRRKQ